MLGLLCLAALLAKGTGNLVVAGFRTQDAEIQTELAGITTGPGSAILSGSTADRGSGRNRNGETIMRRNIFDSVTGSVLPGGEIQESDAELAAGFVDAGLEELLPCEEFPGQLVATIAAVDSEWAFTTIKQDQDTLLYRKGMSIEEYELTKITWRYVFFRNNDSECYVDLWSPKKPESSRRENHRSRFSRRRESKSSSDSTESSGIKQVSETKRVVDRSVINKAIEDPQALAKSARVLPYEKNGKVEGYKFYGIRRSSLLGQLGLKNGDIVHNINGVQITSPDQALAAYGKFRNAGKINVEVTRRGKPTKLEVEIQ